MTEDEFRRELLKNSKRGGAICGLCSFFIPGLGQLVNGRVISAILWFIFVTIGYVCFVVPGIILHIICIVNATK